MRVTNINNRISWGSIIAGVITVLAVSILLSILGSSIGLYMFNPMHSNPVSGIGLTMGIWTVLSLLISLGAGSFVAGKLAGTDGMIHGFLVWGLSLLVAIILGITLAVGAAKFTANLLGSVSSAAGSVVTNIDSVVESGVTGLSDQAKDVFGSLNINDSKEKGNVQDNIRQALEKSGIKELQPEYIDNQLAEVKSDLDKSVKKLVMNPNNADEIINGFTNCLTERAENFSKSIDRDDLTKAIANNTNMSKSEVDKTVDEYLKLRDNAIEQGKEKLAGLQQSVEQARLDWDEMKQEALKEAESAANTAATSSLISFFALLVGAIVCSVAGKYGANKTQEG